MSSTETTQLIETDLSQYNPHDALIKALYTKYEEMKGNPALIEDIREDVILKETLNKAYLDRKCEGKNIKEDTEKEAETKLLDLVRFKYGLDNKENGFAPFSDYTEPKTAFEVGMKAREGEPFIHVDDEFQKDFQKRSIRYAGENFENKGLEILASYLKIEGAKYNILTSSQRSTW